MSAVDPSCFQSASTIAFTIKHYPLDGSASIAKPKENAEKIKPARDSFGGRLDEMNRLDKNTEAGNLFLLLNKIISGKKINEDELQSLVDAKEILVPLMGVADKTLAKKAAATKAPTQRQSQGNQDTAQRLKESGNILATALSYLFDDLYSAIIREREQGGGRSKR